MCAKIVNVFGSVCFFGLFVVLQADYYKEIIQSMSKKSGKGGVVAAIVMGVIAVILLPILIINITLIIKGSAGGVAPPDVFGIAPLAVATGSMEGDNPDSFGEGALVFIDILTEEEKNNLAEGDVVTYYFENNDGSISYVTHRIVSVSRAEDGTLSSVITRGDANNSNDPEAIEASYIVGRLAGSVEGLGDFAMFLQTPAGILVFVGIPVVAFIAYDAIRITLNNRKVKEQERSEKLIQDKDEEIARLRALVGETSGSDGQVKGQSEDTQKVEDTAQVKDAQKVEEVEKVTSDGARQSAREEPEPSEPKYEE